MFQKYGNMAFKNPPSFHSFKGLTLAVEGNDSFLKHFIYTLFDEVRLV